MAVSGWSKDIVKQCLEFGLDLARNRHCDTTARHARATRMYVAENAAVSWCITFTRGTGVLQTIYMIIPRDD